MIPPNRKKRLGKNEAFLRRCRRLLSHVVLYVDETVLKCFVPPYP